MTTLPVVPESLQNLPVLRQFLDNLRTAIVEAIEAGSGGGGGGGTGDISSDGSVAFAANESMGGFKLVNVGTPTAAADATNKMYVDALEALDLRLDGSRTMSGALNMGTNLINNVVNPVAPQDAATKNYVDVLEALDLRLDGSRPMTGALNMNTNLINDVVDPVAPQDAATKNYVDTTEKFSPDRIVDPAGNGTDTTLASALTALASTGGTIYVKAGTYSISATHTLPLRNISIIGAGGNVVGPNVDLDATVFDLGANAIALFTTPTGGGGTVFASYYFANFKVIGNASAAQQFFKVPTLALGCAAVAERVHVEDVVDVVNTQGQDVDFTFRDCVLDPKTSGASFWKATGPGGELNWDRVQGNLPSSAGTVISGGPSFNVSYSYVGAPSSLFTFNVKDINWNNFFLGANSEQFNVFVTAAVSTITSCHFQQVTIHVDTTLFLCTNSWFSGSFNSSNPQLELNGVGGIGKMTVSGCIFDASGASTRGIDVVNISDVDISGCEFFSHSSEGIRATGSSTLSVTGCKFTETVPVNETVSTVVGRYTGNSGFTSSVINGADSVVEGVRRKDVVGGATSDGFVDQFTHVNTKGLTGGGSIKNTGGFNTMTVRITAIDAYGTSDTADADVLPGAALTWSMGDAVGTSLPQFVSYKVSVKSTSAGNPTTFTLHHATAGTY